jgi:hypothetical protein
MFEALRYYVRVDHKTRFRNNMICVAVAATLYMLSLVRYPEVVAVKISLCVLLASYTLSTLLYIFQHRPTEARMSLEWGETWGSETSPALGLIISKTGQLSRRRLLGTLGWLLTLVLAGMGTPLLEAAVVDRRLREVIRGRPNEEKTIAVAQIITDTQKHNLHASPELIAEAANQFATYTSSLQALPLRANFLTTLTFTPEHRAPYKMNVGCVEGRTGGGKAHLGVIGSGDNFGGTLNLENCSDIVAWPEEEPKLLLLDSVDAENATYVNCPLSYEGGRLSVKNVRFVNCTFQISAAYAKNRNVLLFLTAALTGQPITLELTT